MLGIVVKLSMRQYLRYIMTRSKLINIWKIFIIYFYMFSNQTSKLSLINPYNLVMIMFFSFLVLISLMCNLFLPNLHVKVFFLNLKANLSTNFINIH